MKKSIIILSGLFCVTYLMAQTRQLTLGEAIELAQRNSLPDMVARLNYMSGPLALAAHHNDIAHHNAGRRAVAVPERHGVGIAATAVGDAYCGNGVWHAGKLVHHSASIPYYI